MIVGFYHFVTLWDYVKWDIVVWAFVCGYYVLWDFVLWDSDLDSSRIYRCQNDSKSTFHAFTTIRDDNQWQPKRLLAYLVYLLQYMKTGCGVDTPL